MWIIFSIRVNNGRLDAADGDRLRLSAGNGNFEVDIVSANDPVRT